MGAGQRGRAPVRRGVVALASWLEGPLSLETGVGESPSPLDSDSSNSCVQWVVA
jgi:hypothetical protein